jgi:hypothetical protein
MVADAPFRKACLQRISEKKKEPTMISEGGLEILRTIGSVFAYG